MLARSPSASGGARRVWALKALKGGGETGHARFRIVDRRRPIDEEEK
jgi:hypothetical protein